MIVHDAAERRIEQGNPTASVLDPRAPERAVLEEQLARRGRPVAVQGRSSWTEGAAEVGFVTVRDAAGAPLLGLSLRASRSRTIPGHRILRAARIGGEDPAAVRAAVCAAAEFARNDPRALSLRLECFAPDPAVREALVAECGAHGFRPASYPRAYHETILVDLSPPEPEIFAAFSKTGRQNVRAVTKNPVAIRPVTDPAAYPRLDALLRETFERTGARCQPENWAWIVPFCARHPDQARLLGLFDERPGTDHPLLAYALAFNHGHYVEYATAASTRKTDLKMPLTYGLVWELMRWGRAAGARCFDFGGVTRGTVESRDSLGGISDFKRYFSTNVVAVGGEWVLEPRPRRAAVARAASRASRWVAETLATVLPGAR